MSSSHIPSLNLLRFEYNKNSHDLDIIAHVEIDLDANEIVEIQNTIKYIIVSYFKELYVKQAANQPAITWAQDLHINILNEQIFDPVSVIDPSAQIAKVRERIKIILDIMHVTGFDVTVNATVYNTPVSHAVKDTISGGDPISIT